MHVTRLSKPGLLALIIAAAALLALTPALIAHALLGTSTTIQVSPNPAAYYFQNVFVTATVISRDPTTCDTPTGDVVLRDGGAPIMTQTLDLNSTAVFTVPTYPTLPVGNHSLSARYLGDGTCSASFSLNHTLTVKVTTWANLGLATNPSVYGQSATFIAYVGWSIYPGNPGTVTFFDNGSPIGTVGVYPYDPQHNLWAGVLYSNTVSVGDHPISAVYNEDSTRFSSASGPFTQTVNKAGTFLALTSAPNPSLFHNLVTITATAAITPPGAGTLNGCVSWYDNSAPLGGCGGFDADNRAVLYAGALAPGTHSLTAQYPGNGNFEGSTSAVVLQIVDPDTTTALQASPNPSSPGQAADFVVNVAGVNGSLCASAAGTVDLKDNGAIIATQDLSGGQTTFHISSLTAGTHPMSAVYHGDGSLCSASISSTQPQVVDWRLYLPLVRR